MLRVALALCVGRNAQNIRYNLLRWNRVLIGLYVCHIVQRKLLFAGQQVTNALCPIAIEPLVGDVVRVAIINNAVICGDDKMLWWIEGLWQLLKGDQARPLIFAGPAG